MSKLETETKKYDPANRTTPDSAELIETSGCIEPILHIAAFKVDRIADERDPLVCRTIVFGRRNGTR